MLGRAYLRRVVTLGAMIGMLGATLALGACGTASASQSGAGTAHGGVAGAGGAIPGGGMAVRPCPGAVGDATQLGPLALTLTQSDSTGSLRVGEFAQIRLPATLHWTLNDQPGVLSGVGPSGGQDTSLNVCYWTFRAQVAGSVTLHFSGAQPCDNPNSCANTTTEQDFTISVS